MSSKAETVELIRSSGRSIPDICRDLDLTETTERNWVRQARVDAGAVEGLTTDERGELRRSGGEPNAAHGAGPDEKAGAFFAKDSDPVR